MNLRQLVKNLTLFILMGIGFQAHGAKKATELNKTYAQALTDVQTKLTSQGVGVQSVEFTDTQLRGTTLIAAIEIKIEGHKHPIRFFMNIEIGGEPLRVDQTAHEILRKSAPILPRLAIDVGNRNATPSLEMRETLKEVVKSRAIVTDYKHRLARTDARPGSYYSFLAQNQELIIRQGIKGVGEVYFYGEETPYTREVLFLRDTSPLDDKVHERILKTLERAMATYLQELIEMIKEKDVKAAVLEPVEYEKFHTKILTHEFSLKRLNCLTQLIKEHRKLILKAQTAETVAQEAALVEEHLRTLGLLETYLKAVLSIAENGLENGKLVDLRDSIRQCYQQALTLGSSGFKLDTLRHNWGVGAEIAHMKAELEAWEKLKSDTLRTKLSTEAVTLKSLIYQNMAKLTLELDGFERIESDRNLTETEAKRMESGIEELKHLRFQMSEVLKIERATKIRK